MEQAANTQAAEMDDAAIQAEIDVMLAKIEAGLAEMRRDRESGAAQWERIRSLGERTRALQAETNELLRHLR